MGYIPGLDPSYYNSNTDSTDPDDPNSIMYDQTLHESKGNTVVTEQGAVAVVPSVDSDSESNDNISSTKNRDQNQDNITIENSRNVANQLRKFAKSQRNYLID